MSDALKKTLPALVLVLAGCTTPKPEPQQWPIKAPETVMAPYRDAAINAPKEFDGDYWILARFVDGNVTTCRVESMALPMTVKDGIATVLLNGHPNTYTIGVIQPDHTVMIASTAGPGGEMFGTFGKDMGFRGQRGAECAYTLSSRKPHA